MKTQFNLILVFFLLLISTSNLYSQDLIGELSIEICECLEKEQIKDSKEMDGCFEDAIVNNLKRIKELYKAKTLDEINIEELGTKIGVKLINECQYVLDNFPSGVLEGDDKVEKLANLNCNDLKKGDFFYITN